MNDGNDPSAQRPTTGDATSPDPVTPRDAAPRDVAPRDDAPGDDAPGDVAPGDVDLPWKATAERRSLWGPVEKPLEGTVRGPSSSAVGRRRRPFLFAVGLPVLTGGLVGVACLVLGLGTAIVGPLAALGIAVGAGVIAAGGSGAALRALRPAGPSAPTIDAGVSETTARMLEEISRSTSTLRRRTAELRRGATDPKVGLVLEHAETLLRRIDAVAGSETIRTQRPYEGEVTMLEGMATRYLPELVDAAEDISGFLATFRGEARQEALDNLEDIDQQLTVLGEGLEQIESGIVAGVSRSLDVHAEFLRTRFADQHLNPIIDV